MGMAKKRYSKKGNKIEPSTLTLSFNTSLTGGGVASATDYIDLSQVASLVNRRFYRQGINWAVAGFKLFTKSDFAGQVQITKLPNTWVMANAWVKAFKHWQKMNNEALAEAESVRPKFLDFKIYADADHHAAGYAGNLRPWAQGGQFTAGEWEASKIVVPLTTPAGAIQPGQVIDRELVAVGANYPGAGASGLDAVSLIEGYASSRGLPNVLDPNVPGDLDDAGGSTPENWLTAMFNEGTNVDSNVLDDMSTENNIAPYPFENDGVNVDTMYPNGANQAPGLEIHDITFITPTTIGGQSHMKGGNFPCGLIRIDTLNDPTAESQVIFLQIDLVPGNHRGYLCEPMMEM